MKNVTIKNGLLFLTTVLAVACGTNHKTTATHEKNSGFTAHKTFRVDITSVPGSITSKNAALVANSVKNEMVKNGFTQSNSNPALVLHIVTELKKSNDPVVNPNQFGGFGSIQEQIYWGQHKTTPRATKNTGFSLAIVISDAATSKNVWQGTTNVELSLASVTAEKTIDSTVTNMLAGFSATIVKH